MSDGGPPSFSVVAPARHAREILATALEVLQRDPFPDAALRDATLRIAEASSSLYRLETDARTPEAATAGIHVAVGRLARALTELSRTRGVRADHETAAHAIERSLELLSPIARATQRKRRRAMVERELSDIEREVLRGYRSASSAPRPASHRLEERRRGVPRTRFEIDIGLYSESRFQSGLSKDISSGGVFVSTQQPLALGSEVTLHFMLPSGRAVEARGEVCWARPAGGSEPPGMGVRFVNLSHEDLSEIGKLSKRMRPSRPG